MFFLKSLLIATMLTMGSASGALAQRPQNSFQLYDEAMERVFKVALARSPSAEVQSHGTAFAVSESGFLATAFHVVDGAVLGETSKGRTPKLSIYIIRKGARIQAELWAIDPVADLAILKIPLRLPRPWPLSTSAPQKGEELMGMGYPGFAEFSIIPGRFQSSAVSQVSPLYQVSMSIESGMSGGPVLNQRREVIGINAARYQNGGDTALLSQSKALASLLQVASTRKQVNNESQLLEQISKSLQLLQEQRAGVLKTALAKKSEFLGWLIPGGNDHPDLVCTESEKDDAEHKPVHSRFCVSKFRGTEGHVNFSFHYRAFEVKDNQFKSAYQSGLFLNLNQKLTDQPTRYGPLICEPDLHLQHENQSWLVSICSRSNKRFADTMHTVVRVASLDFTRPALVGRLELAGFSQKNTKEIVVKFIEAGAAAKHQGAK